MHPSRRLRLSVVFVLLLVSSVFFSDVGFELAQADEPQRTTESTLVAEQKTAAPEADVTDESHPIAPADKQRAQAMAGLIIVGLLCLVGLMLVVAVALWAGRIRRLNREPLPKQQHGVSKSDLRPIPPDQSQAADEEKRDG